MHTFSNENNHLRSIKQITPTESIGLGNMHKENLEIWLNHNIMQK